MIKALASYADIIYNYRYTGKEQMKDSDFTKLLSQAVKAAQKHRGLMQRINKECVMRFGQPYGDLSLEETLELEQQVGGMLTAKRMESLIDEPRSDLH